MRLRPVMLALVTLGACADEPPGLGVDVDVTSCAIPSVACSPHSWDYRPLVRGATESLRLRPLLDQTSLDGSRLVSDAPDIVEVVSYAATAHEADVDIATHSAGMATLSVVDSDGDILDKLAIEVRAAEQLLFSADSDGSHGAIDVDKIPGFGPHYTASIGLPLTIYVTPYAGDDPLGGDFALALAIDESGASPDQWLPPIDGDMLAAGYFTVQLTAGDHDISVNPVGPDVSGRIRLTGR
jgi:hypothetical protein